MYEYKIGDLIVGNNLNSYLRTGENTVCRIIRVGPTFNLLRDEMIVEIVGGKIRRGVRIGEKWTVSKEFFEPFGCELI